MSWSHVKFWAPTHDQAVSKNAVISLRQKLGVVLAASGMFSRAMNRFNRNILYV